MAVDWSYSFNRHWHITLSLKQFLFGFSIEFENVFIVCLGWLSVTWIRK
jgi:hypothetical protein